jgi:5-formyltetrahydrofolate cyclo-ligase
VGRLTAQPEQDPRAIERTKQKIRDRIWALLEREAAANPPRRGAARAGRKLAASELPSVDLVVCGSVAVNRQGARIGKGGGFSDLEVAFLVEAGLIRPDTVLATTVHPLQVVNKPLPKPCTTSVLTSSSPQKRPSGAPIR